MCIYTNQRQMQRLHNVLQVHGKMIPNPERIAACRMYRLLASTYSTSWLLCHRQARMSCANVKLSDIEPGSRHSSPLPEDAALQAASI